MTKDTSMNEVMEATTELRTLVEEKAGKLDALDVKKLERLDEVLDAHGDQNQKLMEAKAKAEALEEKNADIASRMEALEKAAARNGGALSGAKAEGKVAEYKSQLLLSAENVISSPEVKSEILRTDIGTQGGFLAPAEFMRDQIIKDITEMTPIMQVANVRQIGVNRVEYATRTSIPTTYRRGETEDAPKTSSKYGMRNIKAHRAVTPIEVSIDMLNDSAFDIVAQIREDVAESLMQKIGEESMVGGGDAVQELQGVTTDGNIQEITSGSAADFDFDNVYDLQGELKVGYNGTFGFNRKTRSFMRQLKDGQGQYLWNPGNVAAGIPDTVAGDPFVLMQDLDDVAANAIPLVYGDFRRGYTVVVGQRLDTIVDPYTLKNRGVVEYSFTSFIGGFAVQPEAIKRLKCAV